MWFPLTEAQEGLWLFQQLDPGNPVLNTGQYLDLRGPLDQDRFQAAVARAIGESEALRLEIRSAPEGPRQRLGAAPVPGFADLSVHADPAAEALRLMAEDSATPCDPAKGGLAAFTLYRLGPERHFWYQRIHHLATDGYAMVLLTDRVARLYADPAAGPALAPLAQALAEDQTYRQSPRRAEDAAWWRQAMADLPEISSLAPPPPASGAAPGAGPGLSAHTFLRQTRQLSPDLLAGLRHLAEAAGTSWPDALTALSAAYCQRFAGGEAVVGVPYMGRLGSKAARVPAMVMNVLPLRVAPDEDQPLTAWLKQMAGALARGRRRGRYRSEQLRRDLGRVGGGRRLFGALVNVQPFDVAPKIPGLDVGLNILGAGAVDDITFTFRGDAAEDLVFETDANPTLYPPDEVSAHAERLTAFLTAAVQAERLADVPTVSPAETRWLDLTRTSTRHPLPPVTLTRLIEAQFRATPQAEAVRFEGESLSYAELDRRSAALAAQLVRQGAGPERLVALALERSLALVVALVAVLRSGSAWLPLDPAHPDQRLARILDQARPVAVLTEPALAPRFPGALVLDPGGVLATGPGRAAPSQTDPGSSDPGAEAAATFPKAGPENLAYVIYTSGSTGDPKGVMIGHEAIINRLIWMRDFYGFDASDRILQKTPSTFDVSVWEFFLPLISGATLVVAPPLAHRDPSALARLIRDNAITTAHFVPSMLSAFLASPASEGIALKRVFCSGEELGADLRDRFHARVTAELHNLYGPTEAAVDVSFWQAGPDDRSVPVPIGTAVWNTTLEVLDARLRDVPDGVVGQLYLGGVQLARGYLGRPDLTAERFVPDPRNPGGRLYATGDLARRNPDGAVVYLGRSDHQVKIRGLRIELGEIETALLRLRAAPLGGATTVAGAPATMPEPVREAVVLAREGRLLAFVVPELDGAELRAGLALGLPDYMVPAAITGLPALPVTANGKLDRKALPDPVFEALPGRESTAGEVRLAKLWAEVLGLATLPGPEAEFFALGGDSLLAVRLVLRIEEEFGLDPGLGTVFDRPVLAAMAAALEQGESDQALGPMLRLGSAGPVADVAARLAVPTLGEALESGTAARAPLALIHPAGGLGWGYRGLAAALPGRDIHALQAPMLDPSQPAPASLAELASGYADLLLATAPGAHWHLAGWSVGGILAQEVACALAARGAAPGMTALLDSYPADVWRDEPEPDDVTALRALIAVAGHDPELYPGLRDRAAILAFLKQSGGALGALPEPALNGVIRTVTGLNRLVRGHHHRRYDGRILHVTAALDHQGTGLEPGLWQPYAKEVQASPVPFRHPELTSGPAVALIAPLLAQAMADAERRTGDQEWTDRETGA